MRVYRLKKISEGGLIPKGYGFAYIEYERDMYILYPIPLNLIIRFLREIYYRVLIGICETKSEKIISCIQQKAHSEGYAVGYEDGQKSSKLMNREEIEE